VAAQERVALTRALVLVLVLVLEPAVLLFDEPLSNLDARLRRSMREEIRALQQRLGLTVAYVTHDQGEAACGERSHHRHGSRRHRPGRHARRALRKAGERVRRRLHGRGDAFRRDMARRRQGAARPVIVEALASASAGAAGQAVKLAVRPEAWRIVAPGEGELAARVLKAAYLGSTREYTFETPLGAIFVVAAGASRTPPTRRARVPSSRRPRRRRRARRRSSTPGLRAGPHRPSPFLMWTGRGPRRTRRRRPARRSLPSTRRCRCRRRREPAA